MTKATKAPKGYMSVMDAAERLMVSRGTVTRLIRLGKLRARRKGLGETSPYLIPVEEIERLEKELWTIPESKS